MKRVELLHHNGHVRPGRVIALGFLSVILIGAVLLSLPAAHNKGVSLSPLDALFTSTSAVCVTGLVVADTAETFSAFGRVVIAALISIGGLGVTVIGTGFIVLARRKIDMRRRLLLKESMNLGSFSGIVGLLKNVLFVTLAIEAAGAVLSTIAFAKTMTFGEALSCGIFHSIASFNNAGFDILGNMSSLMNYQNNVLLLITTAALVILGGIGFLTITDVVSGHGWRKWTLNTKVSLVMTGALLLIGTLLFKLTDGMSWLNSFFCSMTARTAGFATIDMSTLKNGGMFVMIVLMFIGASPGSTGGGIKTTTFFALLISVFAASTNRPAGAFHRRFADGVRIKAFMLVVLALLVVLTAVFLLCLTEPGMEFGDILFEAVSAFGTVGLSRGVTPELSAAGRVIIILVMFIGRIGPVTIAALWVYKPTQDAERVSESITIG